MCHENHEVGGISYRRGLHSPGGVNSFRQFVYREEGRVYREAKSLLRAASEGPDQPSYHGHGDKFMHIDLSKYRITTVVDSEITDSNDKLRQETNYRRRSSDYVAQLRFALSPDLSHEISSGSDSKYAGFNQHILTNQHASQQQGKTLQDDNR